MSVERMYEVGPRKERWAVITGTLPVYYGTSLGSACHGDAAALLKQVPSESVNLVVTAPPSALLRPKEYGNVDDRRYLSWFIEQFAHELHRILTPDGSLVIHISGSYTRGVPSRSLYCFELLMRLCQDVRFHLAQEFFLYNSARLPQPAEWVTVRRERASSQVDPIWWLSKNPHCKADNRRVLREYSQAQERLIKTGMSRQRRPSGHLVTEKIAKDNGGSIPGNLIQVRNTASNNSYLRKCKEANVRPGDARTPLEFPEFFIKFLTDPGDLVLDPFAGSNAVGYVAEKEGRRWLAFESHKAVLDASRLRFD